jgi:hypothetical protein
MAEIDYIGPNKKISKELTFDYKEFYRYLRKWFTDRHYADIETRYSEKLGHDGKRVFSTSFILEKRIEELTKLVMEVELTCEVENVKVNLKNGKSRKAQKGTAEVEIRAYVKRDVEGDWVLNPQKPHIKVLNEIYQKFVNKGKHQRFMSSLKKDRALFLSDIKTYLNTHKYD